MTLDAFFAQHPKAALAFSGGVDSAYLLCAALARGVDVRPYFVKTPFQPAFELADARRLCRELGAALTVVERDVLACPTVRNNPPDRCYHCKTLLLQTLREAAAADGYDLLLDGTNASDAAADRPGMRALAELGVLSPLRLCGLTKNAIRELSRQAGLFTWDKPAYACLATRIPTGTPVTAEMLWRIEGAETALLALGYTDFRVRWFAGAARLELKKEQMERAVRQADEIRAALAPYFDRTVLDLAGRTE